MVRAARVFGYRCPGCDEVHVDPPAERRVLVFSCGEEVSEEQYGAVPRIYYACGECDQVYVSRDEAKGCCRG